MSKIIIKRPSEDFELVEVDMKTDFLRTCYNIIDCELIQIVPLELKNDTYSMIVDEEGKLNGSDLNMVIWNGLDVIVGNCIIIKETITKNGNSKIKDMTEKDLEYVKTKVIAY